MNKDLWNAYQILDKVYIDKTYLNLSLQTIDQAELTPLVTKLVYGVLERDVELEFYIASLTDKLPSLRIRTLLKLAMYSMRYMDSLPSYAVVNETVDIAAATNPSLKAFVNALLKKFIDTEIPLPRNKFERLSVFYSKPIWLVKAYFKQYGEEQAILIMTASNGEGLEHARRNLRLISQAELENKFKELSIVYSLSQYGGYFIKNSPAARELFRQGLITFQSLSSMTVVHAMGDAANKSVLDLCSSPGGKAMYLSELYPSAAIDACDVYEHRVNLIAKYKERMKATNVNPVIADATIFNPALVNRYDIVLCDAPCSGLGVIHKKPDILLNKTMEDIDSLTALQYNILSNGIEYCKVGGHIIYSTCTTLREENYNIIGKMLKDRKDVILEKMDIEIPNDGYVQLLPKDGYDGFFIAKLKKISSKSPQGTAQELK